MPNRKQPRRDRRPRRTAHARGYSCRWAKQSRLYRKQNPMCVVCLEFGFARPVEAVDHIIPHEGDPVLFWDADNWQSLCRECHQTKTRREMAAGIVDWVPGSIVVVSGPSSLPGAMWIEDRAEAYKLARKLRARLVEGPQLTS